MLSVILTTSVLIAHLTNEEIQASREEGTCSKLPKQKNVRGLGWTESSVKAERVHFHHCCIYLRSWHTARVIINIFIFINFINAVLIKINIYKY